MKICQDTQHDFVPYPSRGAWHQEWIYCRKCGVMGPFEVRRKAAQ